MDAVFPVTGFSFIGEMSDMLVLHVVNCPSESEKRGGVTPRSEMARVSEGGRRERDNPNVNSSSILTSLSDIMLLVTIHVFLQLSLWQTGRSGPGVYVDAYIHVHACIVLEQHALTYRRDLWLAMHKTAYSICVDYACIPVYIKIV